MTSWANVLPEAVGLYSPELEKDSCGVGFICQIKGEQTHKIVQDSKQILCNMTHRGAVGADLRDGDGAGVMTAIPHHFLRLEVRRLGIVLPEPGRYATGNLFMNPKTEQETKDHFEQIARDLGLAVVCWRNIPRNSDILGPVSRSINKVTVAREPLIVQPFVTMAADAKHVLIN
jgi:glutamate synthase (NADPH/NADH)